MRLNLRIGGTLKTIENNPLLVTVAVAKMS